MNDPVARENLPKVFNEHVVLAARLGPNATVLREVIETQAQVRIAEPTVEAVSEAIRVEAALVILTEEVLTDTTLAKQLGDRLNQQPDWSDIPVIILLTECKRFGDCLALLGQTTHQRSILLLELPLKRPIFSSIVSTCLQNRQRQYQLRNTLYQLTESNRALENFSYTAAHELRNPLGVVTSALMLLQKMKLDAKPKKIVDMGLRTAKRMNETVQTLLDYSRIAAHQNSDFKRVELAAIVRQSTIELQMVISARQAEVYWDQLPTVWGSEQLLVRLISNLIKNAIVHNNNDVPRVEILAEDSGDRWLIHVRDNGPGIAMAAQSEIFELFNRAGNSHAEGSGIGLALCQRIAEQHGGVISVTSQPGEGSDFHFDLPQDERP
ncbi:sensor histidine kinase [Vacuolonema iberomarrocanum]|uniref:sensor histidine kinase n=1 Tax=Vacuolonema iberomarrocanum TaxID=3454632 RepID=UPI001A0E541C|nr:hypothetical protein [filamentous cyanobacterium LEGE 07170]